MLGDKLDFDAMARENPGEMYEEMAFGSGRRVSFHRNAGLGAAGVLVLGVLVLGAVVWSQHQHQHADGTNTSTPIPSAVGGGGGDVGGGGDGAPKSDPLAVCPPQAPVLNSAECPETALRETCTVRCLPGYGDSVDGHAEYRCGYLDGVTQPYRLQAAGPALLCGYNPTLPRPRPPPPPPAVPPPAASTDCPRGCSLVHQTAAGWFSDASTQCNCRSNNALSGRLPAPANYTARASVSGGAVGGLGVDFSGHFSVYKTTTREPPATAAYVMRGVCNDIDVTDFGGMDGVTCDDETVTCDKSHSGTDPRSGDLIRAPQACCKCGGGVQSRDYGIGGNCKFDYSITGTYAMTTSFRANGEGLLNLNNGTTLIKSCSSEGSEAPECKCAGARLTSSDINWYANNIPWNVDKMYYAKTMCTGPSQCEDWFHVNVQDFTNFNRDNRPPTIHYIYMHVDGSMPINPASIVLKRVEGTIPAQVQVTFTVEITHQTMSPIPLNSELYSDLHGCIAPHRNTCMCHFPFTYKGTTYNQCTTVEETSPWCALEVGGRGNNPNEFDPHRNDWAFCDSPTTCS